MNILFYIGLLVSYLYLLLYVAYRASENGKMGRKYNGQNVFRRIVWDLGKQANLSDCPIIGQLFIQIVRQLYVKHFNCKTVQDSGWTVLCPTVQWLDSEASNYLKVGPCCLQLSIAMVS